MRRLYFPASLHQNHRPKLPAALHDNYRDTFRLADQDESIAGLLLSEACGDALESRSLGCSGVVLFVEVTHAHSARCNRCPSYDPASASWSCAGQSSPPMPNTRHRCSRDDWFLGLRRSLLSVWHADGTEVYDKHHAPGCSGMPLIHRRQWDGGNADGSVEASQAISWQG